MNKKYIESPEANKPMKKTIYIPGIPDTKMRPRSTKNGRMYDPNAERKEASIQKAHVSGYTEIITGAMSIYFEFVFPRPKSHYGTGKNAGKLKDSAPVFCLNSKDFDNMEKFYCDAFNFLHYTDDRNFVKGRGFEKRWANEGEIPHVLMVIEALEGH